VVDVKEKRGGGRLHVAVEGGGGSLLSLFGKRYVLQREGDRMV